MASHVKYTWHPTWSATLDTRGSTRSQPNGLISLTSIHLAELLAERYARACLMSHADKGQEKVAIVWLKSAIVVLGAHDAMLALNAHQLHLMIRIKGSKIK